MKLKIVVSLMISAAFLTGSRGFTSETNDVAAELKNLVFQIQGKLDKSQVTETDLAGDIKEFDSLLAKHKEEKTDAVARVLVMKAKLYLQVLDKPDKAIEAFEQLKRDFPETTPGKGADEFIENVRQQEAAKKLQLALQEGAKFPDFEEKDFAGQPLSLAKYKGKVVLVDFWATWCGPCMMELPNVIKTYEKFHPKGLEIVGISLDDDKERLAGFLKQKNVPWQQFFDGKKWGNKLAVKYGIQSIPSTFLLDGEGKIIGRDLRGPDLEQAVSKALAKE
jgi:thiol-disulfide isomerase/thioredoxin